MYYNQYNYKSVPYTHPTRPTATIASSGCGVCCMAMIVEGVANQPCTPPLMAAYAQHVGARAAGGTDMRTLSRKAAAEYGMELYCTSDRGQLLQALKSGAWAIANTAGDRKGHKGILSNGGHYVVVRSLSGSRCMVWDPGYYSGKFDAAHRRNKVQLRGCDILIAPQDLDSDCVGRAPRYYIFRRPPMAKRYKSIEDVPAALQAETKELINSGALRGSGGPEGLDVTEDMLRTMIISMRYAKSLIK